MASLQMRGDGWRVQFLYKRERYSIALGKIPEADAAALKGRYEHLLRLMKQRLLDLPAGVGVVDFMLNGGKSPPEERPVAPRTTLAGLRDDYLRTHRDSLEPGTLGMVRTHFKHLAATLGEGADVGSLGLADLQRHVDRRKAEVRPATIRMELVTLRTAWNWGARFRLLEGAYPGRGLRYPKEDEKPPFMTRAEIERRIAQGGGDSLWECLYLTAGEIVELLEYLRGVKAQPWVYPMVATAAYTGARRSELIRLRLEDVDLDRGQVFIREKKRRRGVNSTRNVPLTPLLKDALADYLRVRPQGCPFLFCQGAVPRSKKRRLTPEAVTKDEAHNHLERALKGSRWGVVRGLHLFRHSFISALVNNGADQRLVQELAGHMTPQMSRRYAHLYPDTRERAITAAFGSSPSR